MVPVLRTMTACPAAESQRVYVCARKRTLAKFAYLFAATEFQWDQGGV